MERGGWELKDWKNLSAVADWKIEKLLTIEFKGFESPLFSGYSANKTMRISNKDVVSSRFANGWSEEMILESYPFISKEDISAFFAYLNDLVKDGLIDVLFT